MTGGSFAQGLVGITLDARYRLDAVLGEGGMGAVFRATQLAMDRKVAVKLLKPHLTSDPAALQRFAREARATLKVDSPHAVKVLDFGVTPLGDYYMVLEYLDGRTVQRELEIDGPFAPARVAHIARHALHALGAAHRQGLIHRDVKPDNLLLMRAGNDPDFTKMLDFGVAKLMQGAASERSQLALTAAGMVFGTPEFMSPEQACGQELDGRSDLYSLAATMFAMLTGTPLFEGKLAIELLTHHARTPPPRLATARPALAAYPELDELLQRCLAKHREARPATADEMAAQIAAIEPTLARPSGAASALRQAPTPPRTFPSSFVQALRDGEGAGPLSINLRELRPPRRGLYVAIGGVAIASVAAVAIGAAVRRGEPARDTRAPRAIAAPPPDAAALPVALPADAAVVEVPVDAAAPPPTHNNAPPRSFGVAPPPPAALEHLRNAEDAFRAGVLLRQLAEADLALQANPRSVRARYLLGDALIRSGDVDRGCSYLRAIRHDRDARQRAQAARCPGD